MVGLIGCLLDIMWPPNVTLKESKILGIMGLDLSFSRGDTD